MVQSQLHVRRVCLNKLCRFPRRDEHTIPFSDINVAIPNELILSSTGVIKGWRKVLVIRDNRRRSRPMNWKQSRAFTPRSRTRKLISPRGTATRELLGPLSFFFWANGPLSIVLSFSREGWIFLRFGQVNIRTWTYLPSHRTILCRISPLGTFLSTFTVLP